MMGADYVNSCDDDCRKLTASVASYYNISGISAAAPNEMQLSHLDKDNSHQLSSVRDETYNITDSVSSEIMDSSRLSVATYDTDRDVSGVLHLEGVGTGRGDGSSARDCKLMDTPHVDRSAGTTLEFVGAPDVHVAKHSPVSDSWCTNSSPESRSTSLGRRPMRQVVRVSKCCKSPIVQKQIAQFMGCKALSGMPKRKSHGAITQTLLQVNESSTQSSAQRTSDNCIQTSSITRLTAHVQTSPALLKTDVGTDFPEKVILPLRNKLKPRVSNSSVEEAAVKPKYKLPPDVEDPKLEWKVNARVGSLVNANHKPGGGAETITTLKLNFRKTAKPKVGSITTHAPAGGGKPIKSLRLDFQARAMSKIGSLDNVSHKPQGGDKRIYQNKLTFRETACSRINSLENANHKPGGGDKQIFYQVVPKRTIPVPQYTSTYIVSAARDAEPRPRTRDDSAERSQNTDTTINESTKPSQRAKHRK